MPIFFWVFVLIFAMVSCNSSRHQTFVNTNELQEWVDTEIAATMRLRNTFEIVCQRELNHINASVDYCENKAKKEYPYLDYIDWRNNKK